MINLKGFHLEHRALDELFERNDSFYLCRECDKKFFISGDDHMLRRVRRHIEERHRGKLDRWENAGLLQR